MTSVEIGSISDKQVIELKGSWDFFWENMVEPGDERPSPGQLNAARVWITGSESAFKKGQGFATYRLVLKQIAPRSEGYSLVIRSASAALKLMVYPRNNPERMQVATVGRFGTNAQEEIPQLRPVSVNFYPQADETEWVVLLHISNFHYGRGGLWTAPLLSVGKAAEARITADREFLVFCLGMIIVIGIYNFVLFIRRPSEKPTLILAIFCLVVCIRSAAADNLVSWYFPQLDARIYQFKYMLEYLTMVAGPLCCIGFVHLSFTSSSMPRFYSWLVQLSLLASLVIVILDAYYCSLILSQLQVLTLFQIIFGLTVLMRAVIHKREESILALTGSAILSITVFYDILVTFNVFSQPYLTSLGMSGFVFMQSQVVAQRFAKAFGIAEHLSQKLKEEVELQTLELRSIMENIPQGVFMMLADQTIQGNYSQELEQLLLETNLTGKKALPVLFKNTSLTDEDRSIVDSILVSAFHEPILVWELNAHSLPLELIRQNADGSEHEFALEWHPIVNRLGLIDRVLVTLRNVTEFRALQALQRKDHQAFALLLEIVQVAPDRFRDFVRQSRSILEQAQIDAQSRGGDFSMVKRKVLMRLHTWKGLSRSLGFRDLAARIHEVEQIIGKLHGSADDILQNELDTLLDKLQAYESVEKERLGRTRDSQQESSTSPETQGLLQAWYRYHNRPVEESREALDQALAIFIRTLPDTTAGHLLESLRHELSQLARDLEKPAPWLETHGALQQPLPGDLFKNLGYVLQHLFRNSMDHGIESPQERRASGKEPSGRISISFTRHDGSLFMDYKDDGRGLELEKVLSKAQNLGLVSPGLPLEAAGIAQLIFEPGFTTKDQANMISGYGIGMDAVRLLVEESGGTINLVPDPSNQYRQPFHLRACWPIEALMDQVA